MKKLKKLTEFDYNKTRNDFLNKDSSLIGFKGMTSIVYYTDGTIYVEDEYYYTNVISEEEDLNSIETKTPLDYSFPVFTNAFRPRSIVSAIIDSLFELVPKIPLFS